jgi:16S rRNA (cytosine1402-N4)-methyltransferase
MASVHIPVMLAEVLALMKPQTDKTYLDATLGGGGHTRALLENSSPSGQVIAIDRDAKALDSARSQLAEFSSRLTLVLGNFAEIAQLVPEPVDGILFDLGLSSDQLADKSRGFSFDSDYPPDMRMGENGKPAYLLLEKGSEQEIADVLYRYGEERLSRRIARRIIAFREKGEKSTARALASLVCSCYPGGRHRKHPATRTFQALRIWANDELSNLESALSQAGGMLNVDGRMLIISYHSLEDRLVKGCFRSLATGENEGKFALLTKKPLTPSAEEEKRNPRAHSARLRAIVRVA